MRPKWPFWKHRAPKMRLVEAQCAYRKHCYPRNPTWESSHFWGLTIKVDVPFSLARGWQRRGLSRQVLRKIRSRPVNQTKARAKTKSSWISPISVNSGVFPCENKRDSHIEFFFFSGMPPGKVHELAFLWFGLPGWLLKRSLTKTPQNVPRNLFSLVQLPKRSSSAAFWTFPWCIFRKAPNVGAGTTGIWGAQGGSAKALARNNAPGASTARATRAWRKHALLNSETLL